MGHKWDPVSDMFTFLSKVFLDKEGMNGAYNSPQLVPENLALNETFKWTKAVVLSTMASIFDPSGIISAYIIKFKLFLCEVCLQKDIG